MIEDPVAAAAEGWYGYGHWDAPYWFIGPEPGMKKNEGDNLLARCEAWRALGSPELLDCVDHHCAFGHMKYHARTMRMKIPVENRTMRPPTQDTWRQLIRLLLAFNGERTDNDAIADYQCDRWGTRTGQTCVVELSALAARSRSVERDRTTFMKMRTEHLRTRIVQNEPRFVVMYGGGRHLARIWNYLAAGVETTAFRAEEIAGWESGFNFDGPTKFVRAFHPVNPGGKAPPSGYWLGIAEKLRAVVH